MKLYMFQTVPLSIIRSYSLCTQQWYMSYRFVDIFQAGSGWNCSILILLGYGQSNCPKQVEFHFEKKFEKISASSWFIVRSLPCPEVITLYPQNYKNFFNTLRGRFT
jgi:hypothetical protein